MDNFPSYQNSAGSSGQFQKLLRTLTTSVQKVSQNGTYSPTRDCKKKVLAFKPINARRCLFICPHSAVPEATGESTGHLARHSAAQGPDVSVFCCFFQVFRNFHCSSIGPGPCLSMPEWRETEYSLKRKQSDSFFYGHQLNSYCIAFRHSLNDFFYISKCEIEAQVDIF